LDGFLLIDKEPGPSSFAVVNQIRRVLGCDKAGHSGTLDPQASGLLIIALGAATRLLPYLPLEPKRYRFGIQFGRQTDTLDSEGKVTADHGRVPGQPEIESALGGFCGEQRQTPPKFSAVKVDGRRAYDLARGNKDFDLKEKIVRVFSLSLVRYDPSQGVAECDMTCSRGTYVRSLARDIAQKLGTVAYASFIRRLAIGPFSVEDAVAFEGITPDAAKRIISVKDALAAMPSITVTESQLPMLAHGRDIVPEQAAIAGDAVIAYKENGDVAAVLTKNQNGTYHPQKVFLNQI
jgi:tRNA pseudouridine55 synthase